MNIRTFLSSGRAALVALTAAFALGACGDDGGDGSADAGVDTSPDVMVDTGTDTVEADTGVDTSDDTEVTEPGTIPEVAIAAGTFTLLVDALVTADLVDTLSGDGPFTVFAPTDDAFDALPEGTLESLTTEQLTDILLYHVVAGELMASDVLAATVLPSVLGTYIKVDAEATTVAGAGIEVTDIEASNGVIHVISAVMLPPGDIPTVATEAGTFTTLLGAVTAAELVDTLSGEGPFTVFAPTDAAFDALPEGTLESLTTDELTDILLYHVVAGALPASAVLAETEIEMVNGDMAAVAVTEGGATVGGAGIAVTDVVARNGIIHVIDAVMLPPTE